ncbi:MAG: hypothetical protein LAO22_14645 [Acidobacteriia bacterium]|nr:hypothetical protein [Terriglobia bacterium]
MKNWGSVATALLVLAIVAIGQLSNYHSMSGWMRLAWAIAETLSPLALIYLLIKLFKWSKTP